MGVSGQYDRQIGTLKCTFHMAISSDDHQTTSKIFTNAVNKYSILIFLTIWRHIKTGNVQIVQKMCFYQWRSNLKRNALCEHEAYVLYTFQKREIYYCESLGKTHLWHNLSQEHLSSLVDNDKQRMLALEYTLNSYHILLFYSPFSYCCLMYLKKLLILI